MVPTSAHLRLLPGRDPTARTIAMSTLSVIALTLASSVLGFSREVVNAKFFGTSSQMDAFLAAATIPTILFGVFNGALVSALIPTFSEYFTAGEADKAYRLASTIFNLIFVVLTVGAVLGYFFAPYYVPIIAHGFPPAQMALTVRMTQLLIPTIVTTSLAGVFAAVLNAQHRFSASSLQGLAINGITIAVVLMFTHKLGIFSLVIGTSLGLVAQLFVQLPSVIRRGIYRPVIDLEHPGLRRVWSMLGAILIGSAAGQIALFFDRFFASTLSPGYIAGMNYAIKLVGFPQQIFAAAIATVIFPLLASQFAASNRAGIRRSVVMGLRMVNFITVPSVVILMVLAYPMIQTLFERGEFRGSATQLCAGLLPYAALSLIPLAANIVLTRCCFACKETRWTVGISVIAVLANVALSLALVKPFGAIGLLVANASSQCLQMLMLLVLVRRLLNGFDLRTLLRSFASVAVCSALMFGTLHWIAALGVQPGPGFGSRVWYLFGQLAIGGLVFLAGARVIGVGELDLAIQMLVSKFESRIPSPPENREVPVG